MHALPFFKGLGSNGFWLLKPWPFIALLIRLMLDTGIVQAADPQPYAVAMEKTGNEDLDQALNDSSNLITLNQVAPAGPFALASRAREDEGRLLTVLSSYGYYKAKVQIRILGLKLDDAGLVDKLEKAPKEPPVPVQIGIATGPLFHLRKIDIEGRLPESARARLGLSANQPAVASEVLEAGERLLAALQNEGYALAKVDPPQATLAPDTNALDVAFHVEAGPRVELGKITLKGLKRTHPSYARNRLTIASGESYDPNRIEAARQDFLTTGLFSSVRAKPSEQLDPQGRMPVEFEMAERPLRVGSLSAAYATDLGGSLSASWKHRNLFGNGEQLSLSAGLAQLGGNSTTGIGYHAGISFIKPDFLQKGQSLQADVSAIKQSLIAYDQKAITASLLLNRKFSKHWLGSVGLSLQEAQILQEGVETHYTLLGLPLTVKFDDTNDLLDPTQGVRAQLSLTPTQPMSGPRTTGFVIAHASASTYLDLGEPGRSVLALRGAIGDAFGANQFELPPDKRFYAGGSATVRGYKYQSIGPLYPDNKPQGGVAMAAATLEFRQRILDSYGAVVFIDAGQVSATSSPFQGRWGFGAGLGARYYSPFGPIRFDAAIPVNPHPGSGSFELYIGIGQAF